MLLSWVFACSPSPDVSSTPKAPAADTTPVLVLDVEYGSEKKTWFEAQVKAFEETSPRTKSGRRIDVKTSARGSGESMTDIVTGAIHPHVYSPASTAYLTLLNQEWQQTHTGPIAPAGDPLLLSPVVIAMWKPMAEALGWPAKAIGWKDLLAVTTKTGGWGGFGHPEWGAFKLAHTHPGLSNSGLLAVLAEVYAGAGKTRGLDATDLKSAAVTAELAKVESAIIHYGKSTSFLADRLVARGPAYASAAVIYESNVVESYASPGALPLVAVYPAEGTFWSDHPWAVLDAPNVGQEERDAAAQLEAFLRSPAAQQAALADGFRPADPSIAIGAPIDAAHGVDPKQPQTLLDVPDGATLHGVLDLWNQYKKPSDVVLVFDKSGSMKGEPLAKAKLGASAFLAQLDDRDTVSLLFFDSKVNDALPFTKLGGGGREQLDARIRDTFAEGGTSLYDAVLRAQATANARITEHPGAIHAVVVMTDGRDENSNATIEAVTAGLSTEDEAPVKLFTIAYGKGADPEVLQTLAEAGKGSFSKGDQTDIAAVFRDVAAFF